MPARVISSEKRTHSEVKEFNQQHRIQTGKDETLRLARKVAEFSILGADKIRNWINSFFRLSTDFSLSFDSNSIVLKQQDHPDRTVISDSLAPGCGVRKGLLTTTLTLRTEQGLVEIRVTNPEDAYKAYKSVRSWWYQKLAVDALFVCDRLDEFQTRSYPRQSRLEEIECQARSITERCYVSPSPDLVDDRSYEAYRRIFDFVREPNEHLERARELYVESKLQLYEKYFDSVESKPLTKQQRLACIIDDENNLVLAGAGSGKTSVSIARAGFLIADGQAKPEEILLIAYGRAAAEELSERFSERLGGNSPHISTFHSLGKKIIATVENASPSVSQLTSKGQKARFKKLIDDWLELEMQNSAYRKLIVDYYSYYFYTEKNEWEFESLGDYYEYLEDNRILTLQGERVKSYGELEIANFLCRHGIRYAYEQNYEHDVRTIDYRQYQPDFYLPDYGIYIEFWGTDENQNVAPYIDRERYLAGMHWKKKLHAEKGTKLLNSYYYERKRGNLLKNLEEKLESEGVEISTVMDEDLLDALNAEGRGTELLELVGELIRRIRSTGKTIDELKYLSSDPRDRKQLQAALELVEPILSRYLGYLDARGEIDFDEMIHRAAQYIEQKKYKPGWRSVGVDEFQDLSEARARLIRAILGNSDDGSLCGVGDDWQSIYRFTGSDIRFTSNFEKYFGATAITSLDKTFRCNEQLNQVASRFIQTNPAQVKKRIHGIRQSTGHPVVVIEQTSAGGNNWNSLLEEALRAIPPVTSSGDATQVLVLSRFSHFLPKLAELRRLTPAGHKINFRAMTIHSAKGQQADYVIVLPMISGQFGLPSQKKSHPLIDALLPQGDSYPHSEERRIFYVALTRAREKVFLLSAADSRSEFVSELLDGGYPIDLMPLYGGDPCGTAARTECPDCQSGILTAKKWEHGQFFGCSRYPRCKYTEEGCPECGSATKTDHDLRLCQNPECGHSSPLCPTCSGTLRLKQNRNTGEYFWGCSNWSKKQPSCNYTRNFDRSD